MRVLKVLSEMVCTEELLCVIALAIFVNLDEVINSQLPVCF